MEEKEQYKITLEGCHDSTFIYLSLTEEEVYLIKKISRLSKECSNSQCEPILEIEKLVELSF